MSHGRMHHNRGSLRRFIETQAGIESFPYTAAYPVDYGARYHAYNGWLQNFFGGGSKAATETATQTAAQTGAKTAAKSGGGFFTGAGSSLVDLGGGLLNTVFTNNANARAQDAMLASQERIAAMKIQADKEAQMAMLAQSQNTGGGISGGTIAIAVVGVMAVGGIGYMVLRKKKK